MKLNAPRLRRPPGWPETMPAIQLPIRYAIVAEWPVNPRLGRPAPVSDRACHSMAEPANVSRLGHDGGGRREARHSIQMRSVLR